MRRTVHLVPHTHWDREWYLPFQVFRVRLVGLVDRVLDLMGRDERFVFTLDGQLATVDDYLEIRPEAEQRIRRLVEAGRLAIGPWQALMDEFLVSGESIVRNLERGLARGGELGGAMPVGYLPDMFGHIAQMPQLLRLADIEQAVVWRGVPRAVDRHAFRWEAPDGSAVQAEFLVHGYWGAATVLDIPERLGDKLELLEDVFRPFWDEGPTLAMYGTDHSEPLPELTDLVDALNASDGGERVRLMTLQSHFASTAPPVESPRWRGELRSGARANMLMNVVSARIDLKAACARAERSLERYAEPLLALWGDGWPDRLLDLAWRRVIENSAHDSICGCSADPVCAQVLVRYDEAEQIAEELAARALAELAAGLPRGAVTVVNPSPFARTGLVEVDAVVPEDWDDVALELPDGARVATQELSRSGALVRREHVAGRDLDDWWLRRVRGRGLYGRRLNGLELLLSDRRIVLRVGDDDDPLWLDVDELRRNLEQAAAGAGDELWEIDVLGEPSRVLAAVVPAPPLGWAGVRAVPVSGALEHPVRAEGTTLTNGLLTVEVEPAGTFALRGGGVEIAGVGRLVDGGDAGDTYNYAPPPDESTVETPEAVTVEVHESGPVHGRVAVTRTYRWPIGLDGDASRRSETRVSVPVTTVAELRAGEPFLRVRVTLENRCSDHRLRFHVPLPQAAESSFAEGQFCVVERGLTAEGGYGEVPLPTFPAHGFVSAGGVSVLLEHVTEYELVDGRELALTLLRAVGLISRNAHPYRDDPAGPEVAVPDAQCRRPWSVGFAVYPHAGSWLEADALAQAERYRHGFLAAPGTRPAGTRPGSGTETWPAGTRPGSGTEAWPAGTGPGSGTGLEVVGRGVVLTSLRRRGERLEARLACESPHGARATLRGAIAEAWDADLLGKGGAQLPLEAGELKLELRPWEIRTLQFSRTSS